jgi:hypothetical protein
VASLSLHIGKEKLFNAKGADGVATLPKGGQWSLPAGLYTPKQIVEALAPLLETCIHHLGPSPAGEPPAREQLIDNLASNLALDTREASISIPTGDANRAELAQQAVNIGETLIAYAENVNNVEYDPDFILRSPCEGHLLKQHVASLMFGPRSLRHLMQIYNEYLHQMVLLRDALLPFENYEEVLIPIAPGPKRGLRFSEESRSLFLTEVLTKLVKQQTLLKAAQSFLAPSLVERSEVGFQYKAGVILPAFIACGRSSFLLRYIPVSLDESTDETTFHYALDDYYVAERVYLALNQDAESAGGAGVSSASLAVVNEDGKRQLQLVVEWNDKKSVKVDLGQIARGRRYAHWTKGSIEVAPKQQNEIKTFSHDARGVLMQTGQGLVLPPAGNHIIRSRHPLETLALLGKLYPDNIVVVEDGHSLAEALAAGKDGLPDAGRFFIAFGDL